MENNQILNAVDGKNDKIKPLFNSALSKSKDAIESLSSNILDVSNIESSEVSFAITGSSSVEKIRDKATSILCGYTQMVDSYDESRNQIEELIKDFTTLRSTILKQQTQYMLSIKDLFGDSISSIDPELFDFDTIEWIDVSAMLKRRELEINKLTQDCSTLIAEIGDSFKSALSSAASKIGNSMRSGSKGNRSADLLLAGFDMISHYVDCAIKSSDMKRELVVMERHISHDVALVTADKGRLVNIHKSLSDKIIPRALAFFKYADSVFSDELNNLIGSIYSSLALLVDKISRDKLLDSIMRNNAEMLDCQAGIASCEQMLQQQETLRSTAREDYDVAKSNKPTKPFFLFKFLLQTKYQRDMAEWYSRYGHLETAYGNLLRTIKQNKADIGELNNKLSFCQANAIRYKAELVILNANIKKALAVDNLTRAKAIEHLRSVIQIIVLAKSIITDGIDSRLINTVKIKEWKSPKLDSFIEKNIDNYIDNLREELRPQQELIEKQKSETTSDNQEEAQSEPPLSEAEIKEVEIAAKCVELVESTLRLAQAELNKSLAKASYAIQLEGYKKEFQEIYSTTHNRGECLRVIIDGLSKSEDSRSLKDGLLLLLEGSEYSITDEDLDEFLKGNRVINL